MTLVVNLVRTIPFPKESQFRLVPTANCRHQKSLSFLFANISCDCFPKVFGFRDARECYITGRLR